MRRGSGFPLNTAITVLDKDEVDAVFKTRWDGMRGSLAAQDVEGALGQFIEGSREKYSSAFNLLLDRLPEIASGMNPIEMIYLKGGIAKYLIEREQTINGQNYNMFYYICFSRDQNGIWLIEEF